MRHRKKNLTLAKTLSVHKLNCALQRKSQLIGSFASDKKSPKLCHRESSSRVLILPQELTFRILTGKQHYHHFQKFHSTGDLFAISFPAGRPAVSRPSGRPLPCVPAGRPVPCSPAGRPNWLAGWLIVLVCPCVRSVPCSPAGRPNWLAGWLVDCFGL